MRHARQRVVLASNNVKKLLELQALLQGAEIDLVSQAALGVTEAEEPHRTFLENALLKARHAAWATRGPALADDSGLCVDALGGLPGVDSAHASGLVQMPGLGDDTEDREARRAQQDAANNRWLLRQLQGMANRRAHFLCVLVALRHAEDPEPLIATGRWRGRVLDAPQGEGGFGYDPLMQMDGFAESVGRMDSATKNRHSHRALAAAEMLHQMRALDWPAPGST